MPSKKNSDKPPRPRKRNSPASSESSIQSLADLEQLPNDDPLARSSPATPRIPEPHGSHYPPAYRDEGMPGNGSLHGMGSYSHQPPPQQHHHHGQNGMMGGNGMMGSVPSPSQGQPPPPPMQFHPPPPKPPMENGFNHVASLVEKDLLSRTLEHNAQLILQVNQAMVDNRPDLVGDLMSQLGKNINFLSSTAAAASPDRPPSSSPLTSAASSFNQNSSSGESPGSSHLPGGPARISQSPLPVRPRSQPTPPHVSPPPGGPNYSAAGGGSPSNGQLPYPGTPQQQQQYSPSGASPATSYLPRPIYSPLAQSTHGPGGGFAPKSPSVSPFPQQQQQTSNGVPSPSRPPVYPNNAQMPPHQSGFPQQIPQQQQQQHQQMHSAMQQQPPPTLHQTNSMPPPQNYPHVGQQPRGVPSYGPGPQQQQNYGGYQPSPPEQQQQPQPPVDPAFTSMPPPQMQPKRSSSGGHRAAGMPQVPQGTVPDQRQMMYQPRPYMDPYGPQQQQQQHPPQGPMQQQPYGSGPQLGMGGQYPGPGGPIPGQQQQQPHHQQHQYHMHQQQQGQFRAPAPPGSPYSHPSPGGAGGGGGGSNGPGSPGPNKMVDPRDVQWMILWIVASAVGLFQPGYIQPDEFFQNPEITAGDIFNVTHFRAWEWEPRNALRSIAVPFLTTGIPFLITRAFSSSFGFSLSPTTLLIIPRIVFCLLIPFLGEILHGLREAVQSTQETNQSTAEMEKQARSQSINQLIDRRQQRLTGRSTQRFRVRTELDWVFRTSYLTVVFLSRSFSNSLEVTLFAVLMYLVVRKAAGNRFSAEHAALLVGLISALGIFNRPTFLAFGLVPWIWFLRYSKVKNVARCAGSGLLSCMVLAFVDSLYYGRPVITPLEFIRYNIDPSNNASHGLHPRYFHLFVSMPQLFGPLCLILLHPAGVATIRRQKFLLGSFLVPLALISLIPHQEPRFLLALLVPVFLLTSEFTWKRETLRWLWLLFNVMAALFFGVFHQGGVTRSLSTVATLLKSNAQGDVFYYKTYIPPTYPLLLPREQAHRVVDLGLEKIGLLELPAKIRLSGGKDSYLITPATVPIEGLFLRQNMTEELNHRICPHWSFEAPPDYAALWREPSQLCLNVWKLRSTLKA
ncbi:putative GPI mannosyltransferase 4 [Hypsibius exemplaris]|uniref:Mannosyltransferase n=1 Tax=Hypsibius exemplaris TaxID=2072580 RepID=A0A1W0WMY6_HYPEX|nr:putative GPI mannosyltransferase 4 [Hypsibius exemplaris]